MMRVSFDLDGVLYPLYRHAWNKHLQRTYYEISYETFWSSHWKDLEEEQWTTIFEDEELYKHSASAEVVRMVQKVSMKYFVFYITQRPESLFPITQRWLIRNGFPDVSHLYLTQDKSRMCKRLEIDVHIEDQIDVMNHLADSDIRVLGVKQPWNADKITGFEHVDDILKIERELARIESARLVHRRRNGRSQ